MTPDERDAECRRMLILFMGTQKYGDMTYPDRDVDPYEDEINACIDAMELQCMGIKP